MMCSWGSYRNSAMCASLENDSESTRSLGANPFERFWGYFRIRGHWLATSEWQRIRSIYFACLAISVCFRTNV